MIKSLCLVIIVCRLAASLAFAADTASMPQPTAPYVQPVPDACHWIMTVSSKPTASTAAAGTPATAASPTVRVEIIKFKQNELRLVTTEGNTTRFIEIGKLHFFKDAEGQVRLSEGAPVNPGEEVDNSRYPFDVPGFIFVTNLGPETYKDYVKFQGVDCFHYISPRGEVWIDAKTMLPVAAVDGNTKVDYTFLTAPSSTDIILEPAELAFYKKRKELMDHFRNAH